MKKAWSPLLLCLFFQSVIVLGPLEADCDVISQVDPTSMKWKGGTATLFHLKIKAPAEWISHEDWDFEGTYQLTFSAPESYREMGRRVFSLQATIEDLNYQKSWEEFKKGRLWLKNRSDHFTFEVINEEDSNGFRYFSVLGHGKNGEWVAWSISALDRNKTGWTIDLTETLRPHERGKKFTVNELQYGKIFERIIQSIEVLPKKVKGNSESPK